MALSARTRRGSSRIVTKDSFLGRPSCQCWPFRASGYVALLGKPQGVKASFVTPVRGVLVEGVVPDDRQDERLVDVLVSPRQQGRKRNPPKLVDWKAGSRPSRIVTTASRKEDGQTLRRAVLVLLVKLTHRKVGEDVLPYTRTEKWDTWRSGQSKSVSPTVSSDANWSAMDQKMIPVLSNSSVIVFAQSSGSIPVVGFVRILYILFSSRSHPRGRFQTMRCRQHSHRPSSRGRASRGTFKCRWCCRANKGTLRSLRRGGRPCHWRSNDHPNAAKALLEDVVVVSDHPGDALLDLRGGGQEQREWRELFSAVKPPLGDVSKPLLLERAMAPLCPTRTGGMCFAVHASHT